VYSAGVNGCLGIVLIHGNMQFCSNWTGALSMACVCWISVCKPNAFNMLVGCVLLFFSTGFFPPASDVGTSTQFMYHMAHFGDDVTLVQTSAVQFWPTACKPVLARWLQVHGLFALLMHAQQRLQLIFNVHFWQAVWRGCLGNVCHPGICGVVASSPDDVVAGAVSCVPQHQFLWIQLCDRRNTDDKSFTKVCLGMVQLPHQELHICARGCVQDTHRCT